MIKVRMVPHIDDLKGSESGIHEVVRKWFKYLPQYDIELVGRRVDSFDILAVHAGMASKFSNDVNLVSHCHGIYWTADYPALQWEWASNQSVIESLVRADAITVPSSWVNETLQRDMRLSATVIPHGIDWEEWQHDLPNDGYILAYAKNRVMDVCNPAFISELARRNPDKLFLCTFAPKDSPVNVRITGLLPHEKMKQVIQRASVVISPIKETFGLLTLESMASGTPVLGYDYGGNRELIKHGVNGYLAKVNDIDDLARGMEYCIKYRDTLSANANSLSKEYSWNYPMTKLSGLYHGVMKPKGHDISIIIPSYNYAEKLDGAIESALSQTRLPTEIIVVDDGSTDNGATRIVVDKYAGGFIPVQYYRQDNSGVAVARNRGISNSIGDYIVCLDADDRLAPEFLRACIEALEDDPTLGIAYTGLTAVTPDGKSSVSPWPPQYDFDKMVYYGGINQIPTCCMFRRKMWERLGGYRSRYCPEGAGSEDAEFWMRAGLYGFKARKVTDAGLFIYSYKSGQVSGDKDYHEVDWRALHPSARDSQHPFACVAKPANSKLSHPVRQYDEPIVSVIIPVGKGHKKHVFNALDSLESQTLRKWEAIVVDDTGDDDPWSFDGVYDAMKAYPYVRMFKTKGKQGSGVARNLGAKNARGSLLLFLDADDNLLINEALEKMVETWNDTGMAVYTDYVSKAFISKEEAEKLKNSKRLLNYNPKDGLAMHLSHGLDYDCERAVLQPADPLYLWNLITTLIPKTWHDEIGGFDEEMPSWEDWEYWLRMARAGKCFVRIAEPMVAYRFYTGNRREAGILMPQELLGYITKKLEGVKTMPCRSCGGSRKAVNNVPVKQVAPAMKGVNDSDLVLIVYMNPNRGQHKVVGASTKMNYGYREGGGVEKFYVHQLDIASHPDWFVPFVPPSVRQENIEVPVPEPPIEIPIPDFIQTMSSDTPVAPAKDIMRPLDLESIPGVTEHITLQLTERGVKTWEDIVNLGTEGLKELDGVGDKRAEAIIAYCKKKI